MCIVGVGTGKVLQRHTHTHTWMVSTRSWKVYNPSLLPAPAPGPCWVSPSSISPTGRSPSMWCSAARRGVISTTWKHQIQRQMRNYAVGYQHKQVPSRRCRPCCCREGCVEQVHAQQLCVWCRCCSIVGCRQHRTLGHGHGHEGQCSHDQIKAAGLTSM